MIPTYNCASLLPKAIESALACKKAFPDTQIEVVDDCSTKDNPEEVVRRYQEFGVSFYRHSQNIGAPRNFSACAARARGEWVHILHGDDYVKEDFYEKLHWGISGNPKVYCAFAPFVVVDENGRELWRSFDLPAERGLVDQGFRDLMATRNVIQAPAIVVRKAAYDELGGFDPELTHAADWDMWKRVLWKYDAWFEPDTTAFYLVHSSSDSSKLMRTGENIYDGLRAIKKASRYFPPERRAEFEREARKIQANLGYWNYVKLRKLGDTSTAMAQLEASVKVAPAWMLGRVLPSAAKNAAKEGILNLLGKPVQ